MKSASPVTFTLRHPRRVKFSVASALLRELGERLVGAPHIALAELVKNSYDADATKVVIRVSSDRIEIIDNGHGMARKDFSAFWMRIGTTHKQQQRISDEFQRPMTGSKGVGRLAAQFLANRIEMCTVSKWEPESELQAFVDWEEAVSAGELVEAEARYQIVEALTLFPDGKQHGTQIVLSGLKQVWTEDEITDLAKEIWWLQPPFRSNPRLKSDVQRAFEIQLEATNEQIVQRFDAQLRAAQGNWHARIVGRLLPVRGGTQQRQRFVDLVVEFKGTGKTIRHKYPVPPSGYKVPYFRIGAVEFEIRVYYLSGKQKYGVSVQKAREYFKDFGGVHVYDAGFHLPYYGPDTDWLGIETDHSHRLNVSKLLPKDLQVSRGMNFLPTQERIFGVVNVDTSAEREAARNRGRGAAEDFLKISVTRDRLINNGAFADLCYVVRYAMDYYAMREAERQFGLRDAQAPVEIATRTFDEFEDVLQDLRNDIPDTAYETLRSQARQIRKATEKKEEGLKAQSGLLGALATAGISAIAYEHEVGKQFQLVEEIIAELRSIVVTDKTTRSALMRAADRLDDWLGRARATRAIFSPLMEEENRTSIGRFRARALIEQVASQIEVLTRGVPIDTAGVDMELRLPEGSFAEWSAIFQNVLINAVNAMLDSDNRKIAAHSSAHGRKRTILVQDTGVGVDLRSAEELFEPFVRKLKITRERQQLGLGGTGLGLTIVKMLADSRGCEVAFVKPSGDFATAFSLSWSEAK
jgi:signal transduction histidine kinase